MKRAVILAVVSLFPFEAAAIVRYLVQDMTCADVHEAIERDGAAILYRKASSNGLPCARREAMAEDSEQPVPCVFCVSMRGASSHLSNLLESR